MKPLRVPVEPLNSGELTLDAAASNYVLRVHRMRPGQPLVLFDPKQGMEAPAVLLDRSVKLAACLVEPLRRSSAVPSNGLVLLQSLAKGDKVDQVVRDATALGASEIVVVTTSRCVVRPEPGEGGSRARRWERIAVEAARQCGRGNVPSIVGPMELEQGVSFTSACSLRVLLAPEAAMPLGSLLSRSVASQIAIFIGPEGGLSLSEATLLEQSGFVPARFGAFTLRTETAATAVLGALVGWHERM